MKNPLEEFGDELSQLGFTEETHEYTLAGIKLPSVTQLLSPLSPYSEVDADTLQRAAKRGTAVHQAIELYDNFGVDDCPAEYEGYYTAYKKWLADSGAVPLGSEIKVYHRSLLYAGTLDRLSDVKGKLRLTDFKTTSTAQPLLWALQLEAYARAIQTFAPDKPIDERTIVLLKPNGEYRELFIRPTAEHWRTFTALLTVYNYKQKILKGESDG